jgi:hypothetical protein
MKRLLALISAAILLTTSANACWMGYEDVHDMLDRTDLVIVGTVTGSREITRRTNDFDSIHPYTVIYVYITELISGEAQVGETINLLITGHQGGYKISSDEVMMSSIDGPFLNRGQSYLLFLYEGDDFYFRTGSPQTYYSLNGDKLDVAEWYEEQFGFSTLDGLREIVAEDDSLYPIHAQNPRPKPVEPTILDSHLEQV